MHIELSSTSATGKQAIGIHSGKRISKAPKSCQNNPFHPSCGMGTQVLWDLLNPKLSWGQSGEKVFQHPAGRNYIKNSNPAPANLAVFFPATSPAFKTLTPPEIASGEGAFGCT
jgi:hypothetical protein